MGKDEEKPIHKYSDILLLYCQLLVGSSPTIIILVEKVFDLSQRVQGSILASFHAWFLLAVASVGHNFGQGGSGAHIS